MMTNNDDQSTHNVSGLPIGTSRVGDTLRGRGSVVNLSGSNSNHIEINDTNASVISNSKINSNININSNVEAATLSDSITAPESHDSDGMDTHVSGATEQTTSSNVGGGQREPQMKSTQT
jgi:hypothetical protein